MHSRCIHKKRTSRRNRTACFFHGTAVITGATASEAVKNYCNRGFIRMTCDFPYDIRERNCIIWTMIRPGTRVSSRSEELRTQNKAVSWVLCALLLEHWKGSCALCC